MHGIALELLFSLDIDLSALPPIVFNNAESVVSYLRLIDSNRYFVSIILKILIEDRRTVHTERINNNRNVVTILPGYLVIDRTTVQSDEANDKVAKLCYAERGPFQIICSTNHGGYIVRKLNKLDSSEFKFMFEDFYILPPLLKRCESMDESDTSSFNQSHVPIVNPLKKVLNIELYNEKWFDTPSPTFSLPFNYDHITLSFPPATTTLFHSLSNFHYETNNFSPLPLLENVDDDVCSPITPTVLHKSLLHLDGSFLFNILQRIHLKLVGFWYKLIWTRHAN